MTQLLQDKSLATKFRILVEIARSQPGVRQRDIAKRLNITPQAVSQYIMELVKGGWVLTDGQSKHRVTKEGVDWLLKALREMQDYFTLVGKVAQNMAVSTAVADCNVSKGETVGLVMKDGLLLATCFTGKGANGVAVSDARGGEDVGISSVEGIVELEAGKVVILSVPDIRRGGSRRVDLARLGEEVSGHEFVGAIGIEALVALKQIGVAPRYVHGVKEAVIEAAQSGLSPVVVCVNSEVPYLIQRLEDRYLEYRLLELGKLG
jgi:putative transcriptional regulator